MNVQQYLDFQESQLQIPTGVDLTTVDLRAYKAADTTDQVFMLVEAGVKGKSFKALLDAELGLTQAAAGTDPAARQRFDEAAGQSSLDLKPGVVFKNATSWLGPNLGGLPLLVVKAAAKGSPRVQDHALQMALGMYPSVYENGGVVTFGVTGKSLSILGATMRSQIIAGVLGLWRQTGFDNILSDAAKYQRHAEVAGAISGAQADSTRFRSPREIHADCLTAIKTISDTVSGKFNEGLAMQLGQEFDLLLIPAVEDAGFVTYGVGVPVIGGSALQTLLDSPEHERVRWGKLLADAMGEAIDALFAVQEDVNAYVTKIGIAGLKYSNALKRFSAACGDPFKFPDETMVTLSGIEATLQEINKQQLINTGNIVAGAGGVAAQNITGSQIVTGSGNNVSNNQYTAFDQRGSTNYDVVNTQGGLYAGGNITARGNIAGRDMINYGDQIDGDLVEGDQIFGNVGEGSFGVAIGTDIEQIIADPVGYAQRVAQQAQAKMQRERERAQREQERAQRERERAQRERERAQRRGW